MRTLALLWLLPTFAFAAEPPAGWRELRFGMSVKEVEAKVLQYRTKTDRPWESTPLTAMPLPDLAGKTIAQTDLDAARFQHWMIGHLDDGAATVRAWFHGGKLIALQVMGTIAIEPYVKKAEAAYGAPAERATFRWLDATSTAKPGDGRSLKVAYWKGAKATALVFQPTGWGPELFIISNAGLAAARASLQPARGAADDATRF